MPQVFKRKWAGKDGAAVTSKWYWLDYRVGGKRKIERTNPPTNNERLAEKQLYARLAGTVRDRREVLVSEIIGNYRSHLRVYSQSTLVKKGYWLDWWETQFGSLRASEFGHAQVRKAIEVLEKSGGRTRRGKARPVKPGTVRGYLGLLKAAFSRAVDEDLIDPHTIARLEIKHQSPRRSATFTDDDIMLTKSYLEPWAAKLVEVLAATGIRIGDALALDWSAVDLQAATLTWTQQKTEAETVVPLSPAAVEAFGTRGIGLVFPDPDGKPRIYRVVLRTLRDAMDAAGVKGRTPHDLRRTFAQKLADEGVDDRDIAFLLGQSSTAMVKSKYTYVKVERARKALARVS